MRRLLSKALVYYGGLVAHKNFIRPASAQHSLGKVVSVSARAIDSASFAI